MRNIKVLIILIFLFNFLNIEFLFAQQETPQINYEILMGEELALAHQTPISKVPIVRIPVIKLKEAPIKIIIKANHIMDYGKIRICAGHDQKVVFEDEIDRKKSRYEFTIDNELLLNGLKRQYTFYFLTRKSNLLLALGMIEEKN